MTEDESQGQSLPPELEENMEGFVRIIDMVKSQFKNVILISHLDSLKDCVDTTIDIDKVDGFAHITS